MPSRGCRRAGEPRRSRWWLDGAGPPLSGAAGDQPRPDGAVCGLVLSANCVAEIGAGGPCGHSFSWDAFHRTNRLLRVAPDTNLRGQLAHLGNGVARCRAKSPPGTQRRRIRQFLASCRNRSSSPEPVPTSATCWSRQLEGQEEIGWSCHRASSDMTKPGTGCAPGRGIPRAPQRTAGRAKGRIRVRPQPVRKRRPGRSRIRPELRSENVSGVMLRRSGRQVRFPLRGQRNSVFR